MGLKNEKLSQKLLPDNFNQFLKISSSLVLLASLLPFVFKAKHSGAIRNRDKNICGFPGCSHTEPGKVSGHGHHIVPRGYIRRFGPNVMVDTPFNLITICPFHHLGDNARDDFDRNAPNDLLENYRPIHYSDDYFAKLYYRGTLGSAKQERIDENPERYKFILKYAARRDKELKFKNKGLKKKDRTSLFPRKDAYTGAIRAWRNSLLDQKQIYWDDQIDSEIQIQAIKRTISATKDGWVYPLMGFSGNVAPKNRAEYIWSNMVVVLIEEYIRRIPRREIDLILKKIAQKKEPSRIIFYKKIYMPAIKKYDLKFGVVGMLNKYLATLTKEDIKKLGKKFNKLAKKDRNRALFLLKNKFFNPALRLHNKQEFTS